MCLDLERGIIKKVSSRQVIKKTPQDKQASPIIQPPEPPTHQVEVCIPELVLNETRQDKTGNADL